MIMNALIEYFGLSIDCSFHVRNHVRGYTLTSSDHRGYYISIWLAWKFMLCYLFRSDSLVCLSILLSRSEISLGDKENMEASGVS